LPTNKIHERYKHTSLFLYIYEGRDSVLDPEAQIEGRRVYGSEIKKTDPCNESCHGSDEEVLKSNPRVDPFLLS